MKVAGILSVRNGDGLKYPYPPVIKSLASLCDTVLVGLDPAYKADFNTVEELKLTNVEINLQEETNGEAEISSE